MTVSQNRPIHSYHFKPNKYHYLRTPSDNGSDLFFGIELEIETDRPRKHVQALPPKYIYAKHDGSIMGFEAVSHPMTFNYLKANKKLWTNIFALRFKGCKSYNATQSCGMHIHLSQKAFTPLHLLKFLDLFYNNPKFIVAISQRKEKHISRWASLKNDNNIIYKAKYKDGYERYTAVNMRNHSTIEVRIFRGTLNSNSFWKNVEFCKAVYDYTADISYRNVSQKGFCLYVAENQRHYPNLYDFLKSRKYINDDLYAWRWNNVHSNL